VIVKANNIAILVRGAIGPWVIANAQILQASAHRPPQPTPPVDLAERELVPLPRRTPSVSCAVCGDQCKMTDLNWFRECGTCTLRRRVRAGLEWPGYEWPAQPETIIVPVGTPRPALPADAAAEPAATLVPVDAEAPRELVSA
jgi:hypothetical protein